MLWDARAKPGRALLTVITMPAPLRTHSLCFGAVTNHASNLTNHILIFPSTCNLTNHILACLRACFSATHTNTRDTNTRDYIPMRIIFFVQNIHAHMPIYSHEHTPWPIHPGLYTLADTPSPMHPCPYTLAHTPWPIHPGLYTLCRWWT